MKSSDLSICHSGEGSGEDSSTVSADAGWWYCTHRATMLESESPSPNPLLASHTAQEPSYGSCKQTPCMCIETRITLGTKTPSVTYN